MKTLKLIKLGLLMLLAPSIKAQTVIYVKADATGAHTGVNWTDAFDNLQDALDVAMPYDSIFVAKGTFYPSKILGTSTDVRDKTFLLKDQVSIFGGFEGTEISLTVRNRGKIHSTNSTILSGDIGTIGDSTDNCYHVVTGYNLSSNTIIEGLTITEGHANGTGVNTVGLATIAQNIAGGIYHLGCSDSLFNLRITRNTATMGGAGMMNVNDDTVYLSEITFLNNTINGSDISSGGGAGLYNKNSNPLVYDGDFSSNIAKGVQGGGGMLNESSSPSLFYGRFFRNRADDGNGGGAMYNVDNSNPDFEDGYFARNTTTGSGGALYNDASSPKLLYCSFFRNISILGGGAIENINSSNITFDGTRFSNDSTMGNGGSIENINSSPIIKGFSYSQSDYAALDGGFMYNYDNSAPQVSDFSSNRAYAGNNGGVICNRKNSNPIIANCLMTGNRSGKNGGAIASYAADTLGSAPSNPVLTNVTLVRNRAANDGGAVYDDGFGNSLYRNSIFNTNRADKGIKDFDGPATIISSLHHTIVGNQYFESGSIPPTIISSRIFVDTLRANYRLAAGSTAINKGDSSYYAAGATPDLSFITKDFRGDARTKGINTDLGVYEMCADMITPILTITSTPALPVDSGTVVRFVASISGPSGTFDAKINWKWNSSIIAYDVDTIYLTADIYSSEAVITAQAGMHYYDAIDSCVNEDSLISNKLIMPKFVTDTTTSINPAELNAKNINLYPNPNNGTFSLDTKGLEGKTMSITIMDLSGRSIYTESFVAGNSKSFKLNNKIPAGVYLLSIENETLPKQIRRLVVQ